jgi:hypothetical protein
MSRSVWGGGGQSVKKRWEKPIFEAREIISRGENVAVAAQACAA